MGQINILPVSLVSKVGLISADSGIKTQLFSLLHLLSGTTISASTRSLLLLLSILASLTELF
jgi:hypothetical protein